MQLHSKTLISIYALLHVLGNDFLGAFLGDSHVAIPFLGDFLDAFFAIPFLLPICLAICYVLAMDN